MDIEIEIKSVALNLKDIIKLHDWVGFPCIVLHCEIPYMAEDR